MRLYERWREIADANADKIAITDLAQERRWTFRALAAEAEQQQVQPGPIAFPQGSGAGFILSTLAAWRHGQTVCPLEAGQPPPLLPGNPLEGIVHLKFTSASTGKPKLVAFTDSQLAADGTNIIVTMGLRPEWPNIGIISLAHSYGFSNLVLPLLLHGVPIVLAGSSLPEMLRRAAQTHPEMTLPAVPALWRTWHEARVISPSIRLAISAGAPLPLELEQAVHRDCALKIHNFYGSSECGGIAYDGTSTPRVDGSCVGTPMRNVDVRLSEGGCVEVRGAAVAETYWPEPEPSLRSGLFRSGDVGELRGECLYLKGRRGDQINVAGRKVAPEVIEKVLATCPGVHECLVFGVPETEAHRGEIIVACVQANQTLTREDLRQFALSRLRPWQVPREWWLVESLAANERGKLSRAEWRRRYLESAPS